MGRKKKYTALRDEISRKAKTVFSFNGSSKKASASSEEFWALNDINFEVNEGDRLGIIGKNGAGKSTLLKILSRITEPSKGRIQYQDELHPYLRLVLAFTPN